MQVEIKSLQDNNTWIMMDIPPGKKVIGYKWVYKTKYNSDGSL